VFVDGDVEHTLRVSDQDTNLCDAFALFDPPLPQSDHSVTPSANTHGFLTARTDLLKNQTEHTRSMRVVDGLDGRPIVDVPDPDRPVSRTSDDLPSVEPDGVDRVGVAGEFALDDVMRLRVVRTGWVVAPEPPCEPETLGVERLEGRESRDLGGGCAPGRRDGESRQEL
jgi:hypothetical protein